MRAFFLPKFWVGLSQKGVFVVSKKLKLETRLHRIALARCRREHADYLDPLICAGPPNDLGFDPPPCSACLIFVNQEHKKRMKKRKKKA